MYRTVSIQREGSMEKRKGAITREHVLESAMNLINTKGYGATSINDIIEISGVKKGNLYFHFSNKEELVYAMIEKARDDYNNFLRSRVKGETSLQKLYSIFDSIFRFHRARKFEGGCIFGNIALEMGDENPRFARLIKDIFDEWAEMFLPLIRAGQKEGSIRGDIGADFLARHIVAALEGGVMLTRLSKRPADFRNCIDSLRLLMEAGNDRS